MKRHLPIALLVCSVLAVPVSAQIDFSNFHTPAQVDAIINNLVATHPTIARSFTIGTSWEGRPIRGIKISDNVSIDEPDEGDLVFVALHHAREWISVEMSLYLAEYLLTHYGTDAQLRACMDNLEIWIIPVLNPDGYAYTSTTNRCWRKNRRDNRDGTFGVDLNRNYGYQWGMGGGGSEGSPNTWEDTYWGPAPFSEPETRALRDFVQGLHNPRGLFSYHSYSELFLRPWGYTSADPPGEPTLAFLAQNSISRIAAVHGHTYSETISYFAFGETTDYFWNRMRLAGFTPELRPTPGGATGSSCPGFNPPPATIIPNNEENLPAALALIKDAGCRKLWIKDHAADTGNEPSAVWLGSGWSHAFWESPDIWTVPSTLVGGATVTLNVRVHNDSGMTLNNSTVRAYYTDPRVSLEFPNPSSVLIGQQTVNLLAGDSVVSFNWTVPTGTNIWGEHHWCVGSIVSHPDDRPLTTEIQRSNNIGGRNFQTTIMTGTQTLAVAVTNYLNESAEYTVTFDRSQLPKGWEVDLPQAPRPEKADRKALLLGVKGNLIEPGQTILVPVRVRVPDAARAGETADIRLNGAITPLVAGKRVSVGNGYTFRVQAGDPKCAPCDRK